MNEFYNAIAFKNWMRADDDSFIIFMFFIYVFGYLDFICSRFISILCYLGLGWLI